MRIRIVEPARFRADSGLGLNYEDRRIIVNADHEFERVKEAWGSNWRAFERITGNKLSEEYKQKNGLV